MKFFISYVFVLIGIFDRTYVLGNKFEKKITNCVFIDNSTVSVELICENVIETEFENNSCFSRLFKSDSKKENRLKVKHLKTNQCNSTELDDSLANLFPSVTDLDISNFRHHIPINKEDYNFTYLKKLNVSYNDMREIDDFLLTKNQLTEIDFSRNSIEIILSKTFNKSASSLVKIYLSHNRISFVQESLFENLKELRIIDLSFNLLQAFDMSLFKMNHNLVEIHIANNRIERSFSGDFGQSLYFEWLVIFNASGNEIQQLSKVMFDCSYPALNVLDLSNNKLKYKSNLFRKFSKLQYVNLSNSSLREFGFNAFHHPNHLKSIDLSQNHLKRVRFTSKYGAFLSLEFLNLEKNDLKSLEGISPKHFPKLATISLSENRLSCEYVTEFLKQWPNLKVIGEACNQQPVDLLTKILNNKLYLTLGCCLGGVVLSAQITVFIVRRKSKKLIENVIESSSNQRNEPIYEEPIYAEIDSSTQKYDRLSFGSFQPSKLQGHYDNVNSSRTPH